MTEQQLRAWMMERRLSIRDGSTSERIQAVRRAIGKMLPGKSASDRTCHRRVVEWIERMLDTGQWKSDDLLPRLIDALIESNNDRVRNPNACFMAILKSEFGYKTKGTAQWKA